MQHHQVLSTNETLAENSIKITKTHLRKFKETVSYYYLKKA